MKYFTRDRIKKSLKGEEEDLKEYQNIIDDYWNNFERIKDRFPNRLVKDYKKHGFHDSKIKSIKLVCNETKSGNKYNIEIIINDYYDEDDRILIYEDVFNFIGNLTELLDSTILYNEILLNRDENLAREMIITEENNIFIDFKKLKYRKIINKI